MSERKHREAFALMWYACKSCGHRERVWNSRDGVTPFGFQCPSCDQTLLHVDWQKDQYAPDHKLLRGQRFWRDGTPDEAESIMRKRIELYRKDFPQSPEEEAELILSARNGSAEGEFRTGWPRLDISGGLE